MTNTEQIEQLKEKFSNGKKPTGAEYAQLIEVLSAINSSSGASNTLTREREYHFDVYVDKVTVPNLSGGRLVLLKNYDDGNFKGNYLLVNKNVSSNIPDFHYLKDSEILAMYFMHEGATLTANLTFEKTEEIGYSGYVTYKAFGIPDPTPQFNILFPDVDGNFRKKMLFYPLKRSQQTDDFVEETFTHQITFENVKNPIVDSVAVELLPAPPQGSNLAILPNSIKCVSMFKNKNQGNIGIHRFFYEGDPINYGVGLSKGTSEIGLTVEDLLSEKEWFEYYSPKPEKALNIVFEALDLNEAESEYQYTMNIEFSMIRIAGF